MGDACLPLASIAGTLQVYIVQAPHPGYNNANKSEAVERLLRRPWQT